jgi:ActR/RegA family two-component response regulator
MARLLVVDDDPAGLEIRRLMLERRGHQVATARNPEDARSAFRETTPETVLLDLRLPEAEDGLALIRDFRAADRAVRIVILAGCSSDLEGREEEAMVDEILPKPARSELVLRAVTRKTAG